MNAEHVVQMSRVKRHHPKYVPRQLMDLLQVLSSMTRHGVASWTSRRLGETLLVPVAGFLGLVVKDGGRLYHLKRRELQTTLIEDRAIAPPAACHTVQI